MNNYDVVIIGGGPGGSTAATFLAQKGYSALIIERENFPRFHIGESLLPATMPIFKEMGFYEVLDSGKYIRKYGARFVDYETDDEIYFGFDDGLNPDIPMAFEVPRGEFDEDILQFAVKAGAHLKQPERVVEVKTSASHSEVVTNKGTYQAKFVIDTTGRDAFLGKRLTSRQVNKDLNNCALFAHYHDLKRYEGRSEGDITIGLLPNRAWTWLIPFQGDRASVGIVCSSSQMGSRPNDMAGYMEEWLNKSPRIRDIMANAQRATEVTMIGNYSHTSEKLFGPRWILAGDAAVFLDPIFSTGVHVAVSSGKFAAEAIDQALRSGITFEHGLGETYQERVLRGVRRFRSLVGLFYEGQFVAQMKKTLVRDNMRRGFTSLVAGDVWNESNFLFEKQLI